MQLRVHCVPPLMKKKLCDNRLPVSCIIKFVSPYLAGAQ